MSTSQNVYLWKQKAQIDYIPPFVSLWLALDAWMADRFRTVNTDRDRLELLKGSGHPLSEKFSGLLQAGKTDADGSRFRANLAELHRALDNAKIPYNAHRFPGKTIGFSDCIIDWNHGTPTFGTILKSRNQRNKLEIASGLWIDDDVNVAYSVYIEIVYQIRCSLFHGELPPTPENERIIRHIYLTLIMLMEKI